MEVLKSAPAPAFPFFICFTLLEFSFWHQRESRVGFVRAMEPRPHLTIPGRQQETKDITPTSSPEIHQFLCASAMQPCSV